MGDSPPTSSSIGRATGQTPSTPQSTSQNSTSPAPVAFTSEPVGPLTELSDSALVGRALSGLEGAFEVLSDRYRGLACLVAYKQLGVEAEAEDVAQEAFYRAFVHLAELDDPTRFKSWLLRITANLALDHLRKRKNKEVSLDRDDVRVAAESNSPANEPADDKAELRTRIVEAIYSLPPDYQLPAVMRWLEALPYKEIGKRLGLRDDTLRKRIHRANKMLRSKLKDLWPGEGK